MNYQHDFLHSAVPFHLFSTNIILEELNTKPQKKHQKKINIKSQKKLSKQAKKINTKSQKKLSKQAKKTPFKFPLALH